MIEEGWPDLDGVGHAHAVHFAENIVGKEIFLVEPKIGRHIVSALRRVPQFREDAVHRTWEFPSNKIALLRFRESPVPKDVSALRSHERAFEKAFHLVLET